VTEKLYYEVDRTTEEVHHEVIDYFEKTQLFYEILWMTGDSYAMHFGIWDGNVRNITEAQQRENELVGQELQLSSDDTVLDAGCGLCGTGIWMARNIWCHVTG
jgi:tocopherol O-methyltransferase